jgi:hypothetical protein
MASLYSMKPKPFMSLISVISPVPWVAKCASTSALVAGRALASAGSHRSEVCREYVERLTISGQIAQIEAGRRHLGHLVLGWLSMGLIDGGWDRGSGRRGDVVRKAPRRGWGCEPKLGPRPIQGRGSRLAARQVRCRGNSVCASMQMGAGSGRVAPSSEG